MRDDVQPKRPAQFRNKALDLAALKYPLRLGGVAERFRYKLRQLFIFYARVDLFLFPLEITNFPQLMFYW
jgi:hypothetical protein